MSGGVPVTAEIVTLGVNDPYPTGIANLIRGGVHTIEDTSKFFQITWQRRTRGTMCVVLDGGAGIPSLYWFLCPFDPTDAQLQDDQYWSKVPLGLSVDGVLSLRGFLDATENPFPLQDGVGTESDTWIVDVGAVINLPTVFGGQEETLQVGDYIIYNNNQWHVLGNGILGTTWDTLPGKPTTFPPTSHSHSVNDITGLPDFNQFVLVTRISSNIDETTQGTNIANIDAIRNYITQEIAGIDIPTIDLSNYYNRDEVDNLIDGISQSTIYVRSNIADLVSVVAILKDQCYIDENKALYQYDLVGGNPTWILKYYAEKNRTNAELVSDLDSELGNTYWKQPSRIQTVLAATTENITTSGIIEIDTVTPVNNSRILVKDQTDITQNGIYKVSSGGAWTREDTLDYKDLIVYVNNGSENTKKLFWQQNGDGALTSLSFLHATPTDIANIQLSGGNLVITRINGSSYNIALPGGSSGGNFDIDLPGDTESVTPVLSDLAGYTVDELNNYNGGVAQFIADWIIRTIFATIQTGKSALLTGVITTTLEVGTSSSPVLIANLNVGLIRNGDGSNAGPLIGDATSYEFRDPSNTVIVHTPDDPIDNSQQAIAPSFNINFGSNFWRVTIQHAEGTTLYYDNKDKVNPDNNLSGSTGAGAVSDNSNTITGRYYCFEFIGNIGAAPTTSAGIRALPTRRFMSSSNTLTYSTTVVAGQEEFNFYCIRGKTKTIIDNSNLDLPLAFTVTNVSVNDAAGNESGLYEKVSVSFGIGGRAQNTNITINIL